MKKIHLFLAVLLAAVSIFTVSCRDQFGQIKDELDKNRQLWISQEPLDYSYKLEVNCFCPPDITQPVTIEVQNGKAVSIVNAESGAPVQNEFFNNLDTVDKLFDAIQAGVDRKAAELTVNYDAQSGYPTRIYIDFIKQAIDDEIAYDLTEFTVIK